MENSVRNFAEAVEGAIFATLARATRFGRAFGDPIQKPGKPGIIAQSGQGVKFPRKFGFREGDFPCGRCGLTAPPGCLCHLWRAGSDGGDFAARLPGSGAGRGGKSVSIGAWPFHL